MNLKYNYNVCKSKIIENLCRIISSLKLFSLVNTCLFKFPDNTFVIDVLAVPSLHIMLGMVDKMVTYIKGAIATCWWRHSWPQLTTPPSITRGRRAWRAMTAWRSWSISPASRPGSRHCPSGRLSMSEQPSGNSTPSLMWWPIASAIQSRGITRHPSGSSLDTSGMTNERPGTNKIWSR